MTLDHWRCASFVVMNVVGLSIWFIFGVMCSGFRSGSLTISGCSFVVLLHSFLRFASLPICLSPAREIGGLSYTGIGISCLGDCIGRILVVLS